MSVRSSRELMNTIESSVTRLLVSTKHLLESLTQWAKGSALEQDVLNAYVQLGGDFKLACKAFVSAGVEVADLGDVPHSLRVVLEDTLSEPPSQQCLDKYLPTIRQIIVTLLRNLKRKQAEARELSEERNLRRSATGVSLPPQPADRLPRQRLESYRALSEGSHPSHTHGPSPTRHPLPSNASISSSSSSEKVTGGSSLSTTAAAVPRGSSSHNHHHHHHSRQPSSQPPQYQNRQPASQPSQLQQQPLPQHQPQPSSERDHALAAEENIKAKSESSDALKQLQMGDSLKRRASRRFSAYQYAKLTKQTEMPLPKDISEFKDANDSVPGVGTITANTSISLVPGNVIGSDGTPNLSTINNKDPNNKRILERKSIFAEKSETSTTVYLKINERTKKVNITFPVSFSSLRLLFIEKFAYSPGADSFPEIYIQYSVADVPYELEEHLLTDVKEGSILSLNVQDHGSTQLIKDLQTQLSSLQEQIAKMQESFKETLTETFASAKVNNNSAASMQLDNLATRSLGNLQLVKPSTKSLVSLSGLEVDELRRELSIVKQISADNKKEFIETIRKLLGRVAEFKNSGFDASRSANRNYMENCHSKLSEDSDELLTKVDDLQDVVEALRKDVAQRGARPSDKQLIAVQKDIDEAQNSITIMHEYIVTEKPNWKTIWEKELDIVCEEQQFFKLQEDLVDDLKEDLAKALETFTLVEHVSKEHQKNNLKVRQPNLPLIEPGQSLTGLRDAMLSEVAALKPNHQTRLDAIEKAEKVREKEKQARLKNQFEEELGGFVEGKKLKKSGGIEETERIRRMKDEQNLKSAFAPF